MNNNLTFPVFEVFLGDVKPLPLMVIQSNFSPFDLTECTEIVVNIPLSAGGFLQLTLTGAEVTITDPATSGQFVANFTSDQSNTFMVGELQNLDVTFTISGHPMTIRFANCFSVFQVS